MAVDPISLGLLGASAISSIFKGVSGFKQQMRGLEMEGRAKNPGYERNPGLIGNEEILRNRFSNYVMPGTSQAIDGINTNAGTALSMAREGAQTSSDILEAASRITYGSQLASNNLSTSSAQGREQALLDYLRANAMAGQEVTNANAWDREMYMRDRNDAANLQNAGLANQMGALDSVLGAGAQFAIAEYMRKNPITTTVQ